MPQATERAIAEDERAEFEAYAKWGLSLLKQKESAEPVILVTAVDEFICRHQKKASGFVNRLFKKSKDNIDEALALGIVWGNQIVRSLGWEWICVVNADDNRYAVAAPDRSLVVFATYFVRECLDHPTADCTVLLSFNMLLKDRFSHEPAHAYLNVMRHVRRIVQKA